MAAICDLPMCMAILYTKSSRLKTLESQLQPKLNDSAIVGAHDLAESRACRNTRNTKIRMIQRVEELASQLSGEALCKRESLREIEVQVYVSRTAYNAHSGISKNLIRNEPDLSWCRA